MFYRRFWYQVLTCVSDRFKRVANSIRSWTFKYFCRSKLFSKQFNCWSVNAVRAFRVFFLRFPFWPLSELLKSSPRSESKPNSSSLSEIFSMFVDRFDSARISVMKNDVGHRRLFVIVDEEKTKAVLEAMFDFFKMRIQFVSFLFSRLSSLSDSLQRDARRSDWSKFNR